MWLTGDVPASMLAVGTNLAVVRSGGYENVGRIVGRGMQTIGNGAVYTGGQIIDGGQGLGEGMGMAAQTMRDNAMADITSIANGLTYVARSTINGASAAVDAIGDCTRIARSIMIEKGSLSASTLKDVRSIMSGDSATMKNIRFARDIIFRDTQVEMVTGIVPGPRVPGVYLYPTKQVNPYLDFKPADIQLWEGL